jgi:putative protease
LNPRRPELLAPAGNWDCARAAVACGADAVYFGTPRFNARMRADNFTENDIPRLIEFLHAHGLRAYCAMNTLIFPEELATAEEHIAFLAKSGVDALIVQDLGLARLLKAMAPGVELHASTQMTITSPEGARFAASRLGASLVVLARELSLREIQKFAQTPDLPALEVFVHGALCVAYSGQCLTSESLGQRSANRGECAQACRLPYQLVVDGVPRDLGDRRFLLSPQDLAAVAEIPNLLALGVTSFKIEGRLKTPEYVAAITDVYRRALDAALASSSPASPPISDETQYTMEMAFSRGLFSGWLHGVNHQKLVHARFGKKRGARVGQIAAVGRDYLELDRFDCPISPGDGVVVESNEDTDHEQGGRVYEVRGLRLFFGNGRLDFKKIPVGATLWKTHDPRLEQHLRQQWTRPLKPRPTSVNIRVSGRIGEPLATVWRTHDGTTAEVRSTMPLVAASRRPLDPATLRAQFSRLGQTSFSLGTLECHIEGDALLPVSELNRIRREAVELLEKNRKPAPAPNPVQSGILQRFLAQKKGAAPSSEETPEMVALCRTEAQIEAFLKSNLQTLYLDFEDIRRYAPAVQNLRQHHPTRKVYLATPRIQKAGEEGFFRLIARAAPDGVLIRNLGALQFFRDTALHRIGDFSLNAANPLTVDLLLDEGLERVTASYDLNHEQLTALLKASTPGRVEVTLHQHIPMFHMEHCVFAAFLSKGTGPSDCGRPCDRHTVHLKDRVGMAHPVHADVGCRNTVFHAKAQTGGRYWEQFHAAGARTFRIEFLEEDRDTALRVLLAYEALLRGEIAPDHIAAKVSAVAQVGVTDGTLTVLTSACSSPSSR